MRGCEDHELQERMKQKVLRQMFAEWVGMKADIWANAPEAKRPMDYETFIFPRNRHFESPRPAKERTSATLPKSSLRQRNSRTLRR